MKNGLRKEMADCEYGTMVYFFFSKQQQIECELITIYRLYFMVKIINFAPKHILIFCTNNNYMVN